MKKIRIIVTEDGKVKRDFEGFEGDSCLKEAEEIDKNMEKYGVRVKSKLIKKKDSAYVKEKVKERA